MEQSEIKLSHVLSHQEMVTGGVLRLRCGGKSMIDWFCKKTGLSKEMVTL